MTALSFAFAADPANDTGDRATIEAFTRNFLRTFENLDLPRFVACFANDASVFFPTPQPPQRVDGKQAIQQRFEGVFASIHATAKSGPPFQLLAPKDLSIQLLGGQTAIVSFHLKNEERIGRRTLVLSKTNGQWLIVHLHASNVPITPKPDR